MVPAVEEVITSMTAGAWTGDALLVTLACYKKRTSKLRALKMLDIA